MNPSEAGPITAVKVEKADRASESKPINWACNECMAALILAMWETAIVLLQNNWKPKRSQIPNLVKQPDKELTAELK